jgi:hypothetical protein
MIFFFKKGTWKWFGYFGALTIFEGGCYWYHPRMGSPCDYTHLNHNSLMSPKKIIKGIILKWVYYTFIQC